MPSHKNQKKVRAMDKNKQVGLEMSQTRESIMPPAEEMERLEKLCKGITKDYMKMAKAEQKHYIDNDMTVFNKIVDSTNLGRILGFMIFMTINLLAGYMVYMGHSGEAVALVMSEMIAGLIALYGSGYLGQKNRLPNKK